jgi:hypothetical protein
MPRNADDNPFAAPEAEIKRQTDSGDPLTDLRRTALIRLAGLFSIIISVLVIVSFTLGGLSVLEDVRATGGPIYHRWIIRMITAISLGFVGLGIGWGMFRSKQWARKTLTALALFPLVGMVMLALVRVLADVPGIERNLEVEQIMGLMITSGIVGVLVIYPLWSPRKRSGRLGCLGVLGAMFMALSAAAAMSLSALVVMLTMAGLGLVEQV